MAFENRNEKIELILRNYPEKQLCEKNALTRENPCFNRGLFFNLVKFY